MMLPELQRRLHTDGSVTFEVRVRPHAARSAIVSVLADGSLKADVAAAPEDNAANLALTRLVADAFAVSSAQVTILTGHAARRKRVRVLRA